MGDYRTKPIDVQAVRYETDSASSILAVLKWINGGAAEGNPHAWVNSHDTLFIEGLTEDERAEPGDWIIHVGDEFHVCPPDKFAAFYEPVGAAKAPIPADELRNLDIGTPVVVRGLISETCGAVRVRFTALPNYCDYDHVDVVVNPPDVFRP